MVEVEGHFPREAICVRLLNHLQKHCDSISHAAPVQQPQPPSMTTLHARDDAANPPLRAAEFPSNKCDQEVNNNNAPCNERARHPSESEIYEKHVDGGVASYKYKNDIKLRFNQDLNAVERHNKRQKIEVTRRNSTTSIENHRLVMSFFYTNLIRCFQFYNFCVNLGTKTSSRQRVLLGETFNIY